MSRKRRTFVELVIAGRATAGDFENYVERWHSGKSTLPLHSYLGLTQQEYGWIVEKPDLLDVILFARKTGIPVRDVLMFSADQIQLARSRPASSAPRLLRWLDSSRPQRRRVSAG